MKSTLLTDERTIQLSSLATMLLLGLSLISAIIMELNMTSKYALELAIILIIGIITASAIAQLIKKDEHAYTLSIIIFCASILNLVWLFIETSAFLTGMFALIVNVAGIVLCAV